MDLRSIYIANGVGVIILLILRYTSREKILRRHTEDRLYTFLVFGVMLGCVMEALSYTIDGRLFPGARALNTLVNTYLFSVNVILPFCVAVYVDLGLYGDPSRIRKKYRPQIAVLAFMLGATLLNLFVPVCFRISEANVYSRLPFGYAYYAAILFLCLSSIAATRRYEKENGAKAFFNINLFLLPILAGAGLQFLVYGLSLAWLSAAVGLVGLFMMQQNEAAYIDSLVDTYNRQYLNHILSAWMTRGRSFAGVMLDIDRFKRINDRFGHSEGDRALRTVTDVLKACRREQEWVFRFAGDEFIVLKLSDTPDGLSSYMDRVTATLEARNRRETLYPISLSYGTSFYGTQGEDIDIFMKEMDAGLYAMKAEHHKRM